MIGVALLLWRSELRVQRLLSRRPAVAVAELAVAVGILALLAVQVRRLLVDAGPAGDLPVPNIAVLSLTGLLLIFANVLVTGEESAAQVPDLRAWAAPRPLSASALRRLLVAAGLLRGALFTATLVGATAAGALAAPQAWTGPLEIVAAAVLVPLPPIAAALALGARRKVRLGPGFVTVPLGLSVMAIAIPFPNLTGVPGAAAQVVATPGLTLLGRASPAAAVTMVAICAMATWWLLTRLDRIIQIDVGAVRPARAGRLARVGSRGLLLDLVWHRVGRSDLALVAPLAAVLALVGAAVMALGSQPVPAPVVFSVAVMTAPAITAGYRQLWTTTALPSAARDWLRQAPLPLAAVSWMRHLLCTAGAVGAAAVFTGLLAAVRLAGAPVPVATLVAAASAPFTLTGWLAVGLAWSGVARLVGYLLLSAYVLARAVATALAAVLGCPVPVALALVLADVVIGLSGHLAARFVSRRNP
ncbi:MAG: hypothetical protein IRZ05_19125 [Micromonosporaceae bacterium]|nr:hypothetical protein [Micromonosporaceae bacterium]